MALILDPEFADDMGLVAVGGDLKAATLLRAYCSGVFPWYAEEGPILWWSPEPRAIIEMDGLHVSRRLRRTLRARKFSFTIDKAFDQVIRACADREEGTWIHPEMVQAYERLQRIGIAHSAEAWCGDELAGGIYGVAIRGFFAAESMFSRQTDGSKAALVFLMSHLRERGFQLFDVQMTTPHTVRLGAIEIPRAEYLVQLQKALRVEAFLNK